MRAITHVTCSDKMTVLQANIYLLPSKLVNEKSNVLAKEKRAITYVTCIDKKT